MLEIPEELEKRLFSKDPVEKLETYIVFINMFVKGFFGWTFLCLFQVNTTCCFLLVQNYTSSSMIFIIVFYFILADY